MDSDLWYFRVGGCLGIIPAISAFVGGWWYCTAAYGFLLGFGLGWLPSLILAGIVEVAITLFWGPALAAIAYFVVLPALRENNTPAVASITASTSSGRNESVSPWQEYADDAHAPESTEDLTRTREYRVLMHDGLTYQIDGPEGASDAEVRAEIDRQIRAQEAINQVSAAAR